MASFECVFFLVLKYCSHVGQFPKIAFFLTQYRQQSKISNIIDRQRRCPDRRRPRARRIRNSTRAWHIWAGAPRIGQLDATVVVVSWGNKPGATLGDTVVCSSSSSSSILLLRWPKGRVWRVQLWHRLTATTTTGPVGFILFIHTETCQPVPGSSLPELYRVLHQSLYSAFSNLTTLELCAVLVELLERSYTRLLVR